MQADHIDLLTAPPTAELVLSAARASIHLFMNFLL
jgi:hypothetical protein